MKIFTQESWNELATVSSGTVVLIFHNLRLPGDLQEAEWMPVACECSKSVCISCQLSALLTSGRSLQTEWESREGHSREQKDESVINTSQ